MSYRAEALTWFTEQMSIKLTENEHKGGWSKCNPRWLLDRLKEEVAELEDAIEHDDVDEAIREAADCANFAMMVADVVNARRPQLRTRK